MRRCIPLLLVFVCTVQTACACSIPVFRYALEHWQPDPFMVVVFHRGELSDEQQALLEKLQPQGEDGRPLANVMAKAIDVDRETDPSLQKLWELQQTETLPWMAVHAPARGGPPQRIWGGDFTEQAVDRLMQSPARLEISQRLLDGDSVVWVYLEMGDSAADDAAYQSLTNQLAHLETTLRLPEIEEADFGELSVVPEALRLSFSALRITQSDAEESQFVNMLLHLETGVESEGPSPPSRAIPIFGRGRAYDPLVADRLNDQTIEDACRFLTGACQCTVKTQNPGIDLLMSIDWDKHIEITSLDNGAPPTLVGLGSFSPTDAESDVLAAAETDPAIDDASESPPASEEVADNRLHQDKIAGTNTPDFPVSKLWGIDLSLQRNTLLVLGGLFVAVLLGTWLLLPRSK